MILVYFTNDEETCKVSFLTVTGTPLNKMSSFLKKESKSIAKKLDLAVKEWRLWNPNRRDESVNKIYAVEVGKELNGPAGNRQLLINNAGL